MHSKEKIMNEQQKFEKRKQRTKIILITISALFMIVMLVLPLFSVITNSLSEGFKFYVSSISTEYVRSALFVTILATLVAVTINTFFGIMAAFLLTKFSFKGKQVLATLIDIPFSISPVIVGLAFLMTFGRLGWTYPAIRAINTFFGTNIRIAFAIPGVILATIFVTFPFVSREIIPILNSQGKDEEEAAALMGASGFTIFRKITLPQMKWGLIYGIILCSARALGEFGAVNALSKTRGETFTLPLEIDALYMSGTTSSITAAFAVSSVLVLIAVVVLILRNIAWYDETVSRDADKERTEDKMYVEMRNIYKQYGNFRASDNVSFGIEKGKLAALLGPSGSGKTTLLRMIAGLENPNAGDIFIDGKRVNDIPAAKRGIGFVFQSYALFRYMTVFDNIAFGLEIAKMPKKQIKERVFELLELTGLSGLENRYPNQLSGGQRQRVAFARALAPNPQVLLLDEPFAAIDAKVRSELRLWLKEMVSKLGITSIFVTHDQDEAVEVADEILITNHGKIEQMGSPLEIYKSPKTPFVAQFVGRSSIVENYESLKGFEKIEHAQKAIVRPEFLELAKKGELKRYMSASEKGIVEDVIFSGSRLDVVVNINGIKVTAERSLEKDPVSVGEEVDIIIYRLYVFDEKETYLLENKEMQEGDVFYI